MKPSPLVPCRGFAEGVKRVAKQVQGALPLVGLLSRLASPSGGIGRDELAYPEFARTTFDQAPPGFSSACSELSKKHGKAADRRYILLYIWMARQGAGAVNPKLIMSSAKRLRVTYDLEIEIDRFSNARNDVNKKYSYVDRPRGSPQQQIDIAVDALARLIYGLDDGAPLTSEDTASFQKVVAGAFPDVPLVDQLVQESIAGRSARKAAYL
eukprot:jgi/Astpho2/3172/e_gw1.00052.70.1_t